MYLEETCRDKIFKKKVYNVRKVFVRKQQLVNTALLIAFFLTRLASSVHIMYSILKV